MEQSPMDTTRILLSNLPPSLTTSLLRTHLNRCPPQAPTLTDLKILLKPDGTSRRIAFAGFKDHAEAERVREWVDGTWVQGQSGGSSVRAVWAKDTSEVGISKNRSKPPPSNAPPASASTRATQGDDDATRFEEFLTVMAPRRNRALEDIAPSTAHLSTSSRVERNEGGINLLAPGLQVPVKLPSAQDAFLHDEEISDMEYMARRKTEALGAEVLASTETKTSGSLSEQQWRQEDGRLEFRSTSAEPQTHDPASSSDAEALILKSGRLFIRNLAFSVTEAELRNLFESFGDIQEVCGHLYIAFARLSAPLTDLLKQIHIPLDAASRKTKGLAYVTFLSPPSGLAAFRALDQRSFQGRLLHVIPSVSRRADALPDELPVGIKAQQKQKRTQEASTGLNWGTLYVNSDAALESIASRLNVSKAELLDVTSENPAVRLALAESQVIAEAKGYFEAEGVNLVSLGSSSGPKSAKIILVKNLPHNTTAATLSALFSPFGAITRLLVPPAGVIAIVEMNDAASASNAWRGLLYKKIGSSVLYLERAPANLWTRPNPTTSQSTDSGGPSTTSVISSFSPPSVDAGTLFIKNLSFSTTATTFTSTFSSLPDFAFARIQTKLDAKNPERRLSMGFGFVGFRTSEGAVNAKAALDGWMLDGHKLEIRYAQRGRDTEESISRGTTTKTGTSTKIIVKNVPFEVTRQEIRELFSSYGQLKSVRLPRKFDHKTRGFAFLDFATRRDAESAFSALEHTHLLGRHLVLEWAEDVGAQVGSSKTIANEPRGLRKRKFEMDFEAGGGPL